MKLLHVGDAHLGVRPGGLPEREQDVYDVLNQIVELAVAHQVSAVLLPGDVFDSNRPPGRAVAALAKAARTLTASGIQVLAISGNHDSESQHWLELAGVEHLSGSSALRVGSLLVGGLSYQSHKTFLEDLRSAAESIAAADVFMIHETVAELAGFPGSYPSVDEVHRILGPIGVKYVAMGDVHDPGTEVRGSCTLTYPGSIELLATNEPADKHVVLVDFTTGDPVLTNLPLKTRPIIQQTVANMAELEGVIAAAQSLAEASGREPMVYVQVDRAWVGGVREVKSTLGSHGLMRRVSLSDTDSLTKLGALDLSEVSRWSRDKAPELIREVVAKSFERDSAVGEMVLTLLDKTSSPKEQVRNHLLKHKLNTYAEVLS